MCFVSLQRPTQSTTLNTGAKILWPDLQVPPVTFTFLEVDPKKGLSEDKVSPAEFFNSHPFSWFVTRYSCQIEMDINTKFAMMWLPSFALSSPTEKEVKERRRSADGMYSYSNLCSSLGGLG